MSIRNATALPRFQALCEQFGLRPTYLTTHEMAMSDAFQEFGHDVLRRNAAEIGMHLHAWNSPPIAPLTADDDTYQPYLIEFPEPLIRQKIGRLTGLLEGTFQVKMVSHRAGRWAFNGMYARLLVEHGYAVDCSVTPHVSWARHLGSPTGTGGSDYMAFPAQPYFVDLDDVSRPGNSSLLEVPVTILPSGRPSLGGLRHALAGVPLVRRLLDRLLPRVYWLRPDRRNIREMLHIVHRAVQHGELHLAFVIHSSELLPGGSPLFRTNAHIEKLYRHLEMLFATVGRMCTGQTLREFYAELLLRRDPSKAAGSGAPHG